MDCGIGRLASHGIFAGGLAKVGHTALDVENVIDNLECQSEMSGVGVDGGDGGMVSAR